MLTRNGKPAAVLFAVNDEADLERLMVAHSPKLRAIVDAANKRFDAGEGLSVEEFWSEVKADTKKRLHRKKTA